MLTKLDRKTVEGTGMESLQKPLNNELCPQIEPSDLLDNIRLEILFDRAGHGRLISPGVAPPVRAPPGAAVQQSTHW